MAADLFGILKISAVAVPAEFPVYRGRNPVQP
jgi:hypothetical protein